MIVKVILFLFILGLSSVVYANEKLSKVDLEKQKILLQSENAKYTSLERMFKIDGNLDRYEKIILNKIKIRISRRIYRIYENSINQDDDQNSMGFIVRML
jgi:hypothetical protein